MAVQRGPHVLYILLRRRLFSKGTPGLRRPSKDVYYVRAPDGGFDGFNTYGAVAQAFSANRDSTYTWTHPSQGSREISQPDWVRGNESRLAYPAARYSSLHCRLPRHCQTPSAALRMQPSRAPAAVLSDDGKESIGHIPTASSAMEGWRRSVLLDRL
ncbi:hypothetical protein VTN02DRAFT_6831 [Thermoascus thermophilus]